MQIFRFSGGVHRHFIAALFCATAVFALSSDLKSRHRALARLEAATFAAEDFHIGGAQPRATMKVVEAAARKGDIAAGLEVARRYRLGLGVGKNDGQAFFFYRSISDRYKDINPDDQRSSQVSAAMRALAQLYRTGIADARIAANPSIAVDLLRYAGSYFGDAAAQYDLATLILAGEGVSRNPHAAVQWLLNASRKGYAPAQALLGSLLWQGEGVARSAGDGLGLLAVARRNASPTDRPWVNGLFDKAASEATATDLLEANAFIAQEANAQGWTLTDELLVRKPVADQGNKSATDASKPRNSAASPSLVNFFRERSKTKLAVWTGIEPTSQREAGRIDKPENANVTLHRAPVADLAANSIHLVSDRHETGVLKSNDGLTAAVGD